MKLFLYMIALVLFSICFKPVQGQTKTIDNLKKNIAAANTEGRKLQAILLLCDQGYSLHPDTLMAYAQLAFRMAVKNKDVHSEGWASFHKASALTNKGLLDSALHIADEWQNILQTRVGTTSQLHFR